MLNILLIDRIYTLLFYIKYYVKQFSEKWLCKWHCVGPWLLCISDFHTKFSHFYKKSLLTRKIYFFIVSRPAYSTEQIKSHNVLFFSLIFCRLILLLDIPLQPRYLQIMILFHLCKSYHLCIELSGSSVTDDRIWHYNWNLVKNCIDFILGRIESSSLSQSCVDSPVLA